MAKWALWAAHRYVWAGASVPRTVGPDGRLLQRPWRVASERAATEVRRIRAARPQSIWPRFLGWLCIGVAGIAALTPMTPLPRHVQVSAAAGPGPESPHRAIGIAAVEFDPTERAFSWAGLPVGSPFTLVVLSADYLEVARIGGIESTSWRLSAEVAERLQAGATGHAYVLAGEEHDTVRSPLATFVWP